MKNLKELLKNKTAKVVLGVLLILGVCDLTVLEESNLKKVMHKVQDVVTDVIGEEEVAPTTPLVAPGE